MSTVVWVPRDAAAVSVGAEAVARELARLAQGRGLDLRIRRNGSRGAFWLEPLVEVETPAGRIAYGPVQVSDLPSLLLAGFPDAPTHPLHLGKVEDLPWFARQERLTFARVGLVDPLSLEDYLAAGGGRGLRRALELAPAAAVQELIDSGLRGRGGAAFPAGIKWRTVQAEASPVKYVVCNADEGDSGTFSDRMILEGDPFVLIEGMCIAGMVCGARRGYVYLRSEYPAAELALQAAVDAARAGGLLGEDVLGSGRAFDIEVRRGAGAYICGEETSLLESLEGRRGMVRYRPPLPAVQGLFGKPTVLNNVITFSSVPVIFDRGAAAYRGHGMGRSRGTLPFQLGGNIRRGGIVEKAFGLTLNELLHDFGGGSASGRPIRAAQVGGPLGAWVPASRFDTVLDYEAFAGIGAMVGHGGVVAVDDTVDLGRMARFAMEFCALESCGKCTPCRIGSTRAVEVIDRIRGGDAAQVPLLRDLCDTMIHGSLCALGGMAPFPVLSVLEHFPADFGLNGTADAQARRSA